MPSWVRIADGVTLVLLALTLSITVFGGFRVDAFGARLSVTGAWRPLLAAVAVMAFRHWRWRRPAIGARVTHAVVRWWRSPETRVVWPIWITTRLGVLAVGFLAVSLIGYPAGKPVPFRISANELVNLPARYDAGWYLGIANEGYEWSEGSGQQNIAFFPAFPMAMRYTSIVLGRQPLWAGVAVSFVAFFLALVYLLRLARDLLGDEHQARAGVALLASYPFAVYYSAPYTEALYLLAAAGAIYHFRRGAVGKTAAWGVLAGLTRPNGALLSVVLGVMVLETLWAERRARGGWTGVPWMAHLDRLAAAAAPGIGMLVYSTFILFLTGHPFQWTAQNAAWGRVYRPIDTLVTDRLSYVEQFGLYAYAADQTLDMVYLVSVLFILAAVWPVGRRLGWAFAVLLLVNLLPPLAAGGLLSMGRVTSTLFPAFIWLGAVVPAAQRTGWLMGFALLQGLMAALFFTWRPPF